MSIVVIMAVAALLGFVLFKALASSDRAADPWAEKWEAVAEALGLQSRVPTDAKRPSSLKGEVAGYDVTVWSRKNGEPKIEVDFESGLRQLKIRRRRGDALLAVGKAPKELLTGDPAFDKAFVMSDRGLGENVALEWLTGERRKALLSLSELVTIDEVEEDELEVRMRNADWEAQELIDAIRRCVETASRLDQNARPQDTIASQDTVGQPDLNIIVPPPVQDS